MSAQHTPGPWWSKEAADGSGDMGICADDDSGLYGAVVVAEVCRDIRRKNEAVAEGRANACLIAAAPDLLTALQAMTEIAELTVGWMSTPLSADGPLIQARAAIAKATGSAK